MTKSVSEGCICQMIMSCSMWSGKCLDERNQNSLKAKLWDQRRWNDWWINYFEPQIPIPYPSTLFPILLHAFD